MARGQRRGEGTRGSGLPLTRPPTAPRPWVARLTTTPGPPEARLWQRAGATVLAVPGRYSVTYALVGEGGVVLVDVGSRTDEHTVREALRWLGLGPGDVRYQSHHID